MFRIPDIVPEADLIALLGSLFAAQSIILVFEMFILQSWSDGAQRLADTAHEADEKTAMDSLDRLAITRRIGHQKRHLPWIQLSVLALATLVLAGVALLLSFAIDALPWLYTTAPVVVLVLAFVGGTVGIISSGIGVLNDAYTRLSGRVRQSA